MSWLKKSQNMDNFQAAIVEGILNRHTNGSPEDVREELSASGVSNPCPALELLCNSGKVVPPFYMTVFSYLCGSTQSPNNSNTANMEVAPQQKLQELPELSTTSS